MLYEDLLVAATHVHSWIGIPRSAFNEYEGQSKRIERALTEMCYTAMPLAMPTRNSAVCL